MFLLEMLRYARKNPLKTMVFLLALTSRANLTEGNNQPSQSDSLVPMPNPNQEDSKSIAHDNPRYLHEIQLGQVYLNLLIQDGRLQDIGEVLRIKPELINTNINEKEKTFLHPFIYAVTQASPTVVAYFFENRVKYNIDFFKFFPFDHIQYPLLKRLDALGYACFYSHPAMIKYLLSIRDEYNKGYLAYRYYDKNFNYIALTAVMQNQNAFDAIKESGVNINHCSDMPPVFAVLSYELTNKARYAALKFLGDNKVDLNAKYKIDNVARSALSYATASGQQQEVSYLLQHGAKYDSPDSDGCYPIQNAIDNFSTEMMIIYAKHKVFDTESQVAVVIRHVTIRVNESKMNRALSLALFDFINRLNQSNLTKPLYSKLAHLTHQLDTIINPNNSKKNDGPSLVSPWNIIGLFSIGGLFKYHYSRRPNVPAHLIGQYQLVQSADEHPEEHEEILAPKVNDAAAITETVCVISQPRPKKRGKKPKQVVEENKNEPILLCCGENLSNNDANPVAKISPDEIKSKRVNPKHTIKKIINQQQSNPVLPKQHLPAPAATPANHNFIVDIFVPPGYVPPKIEASKGQQIQIQAVQKKSNVKTINPKFYASCAADSAKKLAVLLTLKQQDFSKKILGLALGYQILCFYLSVKLHEEKVNNNPQSEKAIIGTDIRNIMTHLFSQSSHEEIIKTAEFLQTTVARDISQLKQDSGFLKVVDERIVREIEDLTGYAKSNVSFDHIVQSPIYQQANSVLGAMQQSSESKEQNNLVEDYRKWVLYTMIPAINDVASWFMKEGVQINLEQDLEAIARITALRSLFILCGEYAALKPVNVSWGNTLDAFIKDCRYLRNDLTHHPMPKADGLILKMCRVALIISDAKLKCDDANLAFSVIKVNLPKAAAASI